MMKGKEDILNYKLFILCTYLLFTLPYWDKGLRVKQAESSERVKKNEKNDERISEGAQGI